MGGDRRGGSGAGAARRTRPAAGGLAVGHGPPLAAPPRGEGAGAGGALAQAAGGRRGRCPGPPAPGAFLWASWLELRLGPRSPPLWRTLRALLGVRCRLPALLRRWLFLARRRVSVLGGGRGARSSSQKHRLRQPRKGPRPALPAAAACVAAPGAGGRVRAGESVEAIRPFVPSKQCGIPVNFESVLQRIEPRKINSPRAK